MNIHSIFSYKHTHTHTLRTDCVAFSIHYKFPLIRSLWPTIRLRSFVLVLVLHMKYAHFRLHSLNEIAFTNISIVLDEQFKMLLIELEHIESLRVKVLPNCRTWKRVGRMWSNVEGRRKMQTLLAIHMNAVDTQFSLQNYSEIWQFLNI